MFVAFEGRKNSEMNVRWSTLVGDGKEPMQMLQTFAEDAYILSGYPSQ